MYAEQPFEAFALRLLVVSLLLEGPEPPDHGPDLLLHLRHLPSQGLFLLLFPSDRGLTCDMVFG
jgi:hypothetical protein